MADSRERFAHNGAGLNKITAKIRSGKAHELSEGDTTYLGACRKGQKGDADQFYTLPSGELCEIPAPRRAFSLKPQYMRMVLDFIQKSGNNSGMNTAALVEGVYSRSCYQRRTKAAIIRGYINRPI